MACGDVQGGVFGLLTGSNVARFALPAPEPPMEAASMSAPAAPVTAPPSAVAALSSSHAAEDSPSGYVQDAEPQVQPIIAASSGVTDPSPGVSPAAYSSQAAVASKHTGSAQSRPPPAPSSDEVSPEAGSACQQQPSGVPAALHTGTAMPDDQLPPELGDAPRASRPSSQLAHPVQQGSRPGQSLAEVTAEPKREAGADVPAAAAPPEAAATSAIHVAPVAEEPEGEPHLREIVALPVAEAPREPDPEQASPAPAATEAPPAADYGLHESASVEERACAPPPEPHAASDATQTMGDIADQPGSGDQGGPGSRSIESPLGHTMTVDERGLSENGHVSVAGERLDSNGDAASGLPPSSQAVLEATGAGPAASALPSPLPTAVAGPADTLGSAASGVSKEPASAPRLPKQELQAAVSDSPPPAEPGQCEKTAKPEAGPAVYAVPQAPATQITAASPKPAVATPPAAVSQPSAQTAEAKSLMSDAASERQSPAMQPARAAPQTSVKGPISAQKPSPQPQTRRAQAGAAPQAASPAPSGTPKSVAPAASAVPQATDPLQSLLGQSQPASQPTPAAPAPRIIASPVQVMVSPVLCY